MDCFVALLLAMTAYAKGPSMNADTLLIAAGAVLIVVKR
jgi:hypothetical protein